MKRFVLLGFTIAIFWVSSASIRANFRRQVQAAGIDGASGATSLSFKEFFEPKKKDLEPSHKVLDLNGKRVRLVGFMAQMEAPPSGGFYLCPRPVFGDEEGGGTADLPAESVLVVVRSQKGRTVPFSPRALEVTGILEVGPKTAEDGSTSYFRLILDGPQNTAPSKPSTRGN